VTLPRPELAIVQIAGDDGKENVGFGRESLAFRQSALSTND
jgi:hypothetical protein